MVKKIFLFSLMSAALGICLAAFVSAQQLAEFKLPREVPPAFEIEWNQFSSMGRSSEIIKLNKNVLTHEQKNAGEKNAVKWTADVSAEDIKALYGLFVENRFDLIKNEGRKGMVLDAGSQAVRMTIENGGGFHNVQYGPNSPLSDENKIKYQKLADAIKALAEKYKAKGTAVKQ
jgi:hypothetical protein